jgi:hypothetical protein
LNIKWQCGPAARFRPQLESSATFPRCEIDAALILCARFTRSGSCRSTARLLVCGVFSPGDFDFVFVKTLSTSIQKLAECCHGMKRDWISIERERDNIIWLCVHLGQQGLRLAPRRPSKGFCTLNLEDEDVLYSLQQRPLNGPLNLENVAGSSIRTVSLNGSLSI